VVISTLHWIYWLPILNWITWLLKSLNLCDLCVIKFYFKLLLMLFQSHDVWIVKMWSAVFSVLFHHNNCTTSVITSMDWICLSFHCFTAFSWFTICRTWNFCSSLVFKFISLVDYWPKNDDKNDESWPSWLFLYLMFLKWFWTSLFYIIIF